MAVTQIQLLRSSVPNDRPIANQLLPGQPAVNIDASQPGLFFADSNGSLFKVGPCTVSTIAPNVDAAGSVGNSKGELWFDVNEQKLKVWTGAIWADADPSEAGFSKAIVQPSPPDLTVYPEGALWWNDGNGEMYVLYEDVNGRQWVQVGAGGGGSGGAVIVAAQRPDPAITAVGTLWWDDDNGSLFVLYNDGGPERLWIQIAGAGAINAGMGGTVSKIDTGTGLTTLTGQPITTTGTLVLKPPADNEIGGVKAGTGVTIDSDGTINMSGPGSGTVTNIQTGTGLSGGPITSTGTITLNSATSSTIGGVSPGAGTGVTPTGQLFLEPATTAGIGGIIVGQGLNVTSDGVLAVDSVPPGSIPAGLIQWFGGSTPPTGWLFCNGQTLSTTSFPALFAAIGRTYTGTTVPSNQFQVPDLRGQFLRGWDDRSSGGVDSGRVFGSFQNDEFKSHKHTFADSDPSWSNTMDQLSGGGGPGLTSGGNVRFGKPETTDTGGTETRPKNLALLPIIKT
jgi:hypothetical protein